MKNRSFHVVALVLMFLFAFPTPQLIVHAQEASTNTTQEKSKVESEEEKKLRKMEESKNKKEEDRKRKEEKARVNEARKYQTLSDFAADLYASDLEFRDQVDDAYLDLQRRHASEAYQINISHQKELLATENQGELLELHRALYDNPRVQEYVNRLGQQIVPDDSDKLYSFRVFVSPIPRAYTLSTGTVLVSTGMISLLDNEAQLAYILAHELAHVYNDHWRMKVMLPLAEEEYNKKQERKRLMWASLASLAGVGIGAAIDGKTGALIGGAAGFGAGYGIGMYYARKIALDWNTAQENEADDFALKATLGKSFDIQEVPRLYVMMAQAAEKDNRIQLGFLGARSRIRERNDHAQKLITGSLHAQYQDAVKANKLRGTGPDFNLIMAELKRDNGIRAFYYDMFQLAKKNLEQAVMSRSDDPVAAYYYGRVMKQVGRTKEELDLAQQSLLKAISLDTRQEIPEIQLHRALMLMDSKDPSANVEAIGAFKNYITLYGRKRASTISNDELVPPNIDVLYGYMRLLGDKTWTAPSVVEIIKATSGNATGTGPQTPATIPKVVPGPEFVSPTKTKKPGRP